MSQFKNNSYIPFQCAFPLSEIGSTGSTGVTGPTGSPGTCITGPTGLHQLTIGVNVVPHPVLTLSRTFFTLSTLTMTIDDPGDTVRFIATIYSVTSGSSVNSSPLSGNVVQYQIRRVAPAATIISFRNTDFDELTTTFTAFDNPGVGTFTYILEAILVRVTTPPGTNIEIINNVIFTAEEIEPN